MECRRGCRRRRVSVESVLSSTRYSHRFPNGRRLEPRVLRCVGDGGRKMNGAADDLELAQKCKKDCKDPRSALPPRNDENTDSRDVLPLPVGPLMRVSCPSGKSMERSLSSKAPSAALV